MNHGNYKLIPAPCRQCVRSNYAQGNKREGEMRGRDKTMNRLIRFAQYTACKESNSDVHEEVKLCTLVYSQRTEDTPSIHQMSVYDSDSQ